jgi:hypothetical protein
MRANWGLHATSPVRSRGPGLLVWSRTITERSFYFQPQTFPNPAGAVSAQAVAFGAFALTIGV